MAEESEVDESSRHVRLEHLSLAIFTVSLIFNLLSVIAVCGRTYMRATQRSFGFDDGLILAGMIVYTADVALSCYGTTIGVGSPDSKLNNNFLSEQATKVFNTWILIYLIDLVLIKSSICVTLLRIASKNAVEKTALLRLSIWIILGINWASFLVDFIGVLTFCRPLAAMWKPELVASGRGTCASTKTMVALSYTSTAAAMLSDLGCAVVPALFLRRIQMGPKAKKAVLALLSFASLASVVTILRIPFILHFYYPEDNLPYWTGYIVLFSNIESGIGCIASSAPALRQLYLASFLGQSEGEAASSSSSPSQPKAKRGDDSSLVTFGRLPPPPKRTATKLLVPRRRSLSRRDSMATTDVGGGGGISLATIHRRDWERLQGEVRDN